MPRIRCLLGLDDTDHSEVGCTTESMNDLLSFIQTEIDCRIVERRLVRLWPFAERRTRGNGALGAVLEISHNLKQSMENICEDWFHKLTKTVDKYPKSGISPSPCLIISWNPVPEEWYWESVRSFVDPKIRSKQGIDIGCRIFHSGTKFGIVGACAAISWIPNTKSSWELVAWRKNDLIGRKRMVSNDAVLFLENEHPGTFLNRDPTKGTSLIAPRTPCPVLYGIRGSSEHVVTKAHHSLQERKDVEFCDTFATHITNQLSDDHIESVHSGTVTSVVSETKGGHAFTNVFSSGKIEKIVAFSESGEVNRLLRTLTTGDKISWTGLTSPEGSIHLEKLRLNDHCPRILGRPSCCSRTMRSAGKGQHLRCLDCGNTERKHWVCQDFEVLTGFPVGEWIEPSASNRRHLSKPLSLGSPGTI